MVDTLLFGAMTLAYIAITFYLGYLGYKKTKKAEDYMICGRKIHPIVLALSYGVPSSARRPSWASAEPRPS